MLIYLKSQNWVYDFLQHDLAMLAFVNAIGSSNDLQPPYASVLLLELYETYNTYGVKLLFRNDTDAEPYALDIPGMNIFI